MPTRRPRQPQRLNHDPFAGADDDVYNGPHTKKKITPNKLCNKYGHAFPFQANIRLYDGTGEEQVSCSRCGYEAIHIWLYRCTMDKYSHDIIMDDVQVALKSLEKYNKELAAQWLQQYRVRKAELLQPAQLRRLVEDWVHPTSIVGLDESRLEESMVHTCEDIQRRIVQSCDNRIRLTNGEKARVLQAVRDYYTEHRTRPSNAVREDRRRAQASVYDTFITNMGSSPRGTSIPNNLHPPGAVTPALNTEISVSGADRLRGIDIDRLIIDEAVELPDISEVEDWGDEHDEE